MPKVPHRWYAVTGMGRSNLRGEEIRQFAAECITDPAKSKYSGVGLSQLNSRQARFFEFTQVSKLTQ